MSRLTLSVLQKEFSIHRLNPDAGIPRDLVRSTFYSITKTDEELSIVCESEIEIESIKEDKGWSCLKVIGPLDLNLTGIMANIASVLAKSDISIFAVSTYDTDYILVKTVNLERAKEVLATADYQIM